MNPLEMADVVALCSYPEYRFEVLTDGRGAHFLQGSYMEADIHTGLVHGGFYPHRAARVAEDAPLVPITIGCCLSREKTR